jgi:hypothetical protein
VTGFDKDPTRMALAATVLVAAIAGTASAAPPVAVDPNKAVAPITKPQPIIAALPTGGPPAVPPPPPPPCPCAEATAGAGPAPYSAIRDLHMASWRQSINQPGGEYMGTVVSLAWSPVPGVTEYSISWGPPGGPYVHRSYALSHGGEYSYYFRYGTGDNLKAFVVVPNNGTAWPGQSNEVIVRLRY